MDGSGYRISTLTALTREDGWVPVRRSLGISAFGVNAWHAEEAGDELIMEHVESDQQELYLVLSGHATFTIAGDELDAPAGTLIFVEDPAIRRRAIAARPGTTVLSVGAPAGAAFAPSAWETNRDVLPLFARGHWQEARAVLLDALARYRDRAFLLYNLACAEAQLGRDDQALRWLAEAIEARPELAALAAHDDDLAPLQDHDDFAGLTETGA